MKVGVEITIDVTKIDKTRIFEGKKGKYLKQVVFIDLDNKDQYGNNGMVTHAKNEGEERAPILGNAKVFWSDSKQETGNSANVNNVPNVPDLDDGSIPF